MNLLSENKIAALNCENTDKELVKNILDNIDKESVKKVSEITYIIKPKNTYFG